MDDTVGEGVSEDLLRALHQSQCSHRHKGEPSHKCAGVITVTPKGIEASCALCGSDSGTYGSDYRGYRQDAIRILAAAGLEFSRLSGESQAQVMKELARRRCQGCGSETSPVGVGRDLLPCHCGWRWSADRWWSPEAWVTGNLVEGTLLDVADAAIALKGDADG